MSNLFNLLGNDVEDASDVSVPREIVKKSTSSKKADVPPPSANKDRARKDRPQPTGNEAAIKDKNAGRAANKARGVDEKPAKSGKPSKGGKFDRHSRTGKTDSEKKVKQAGWVADGESELANEIEGAEDAAEELKEDAEPKVAKKSLEEYLKEKEAAAAAANAQRAARKVESVSEEDIIVKEQEVFIAATKEKKVKSKQLKAKKILEFDATFADELPSSAPRRENAPRGGRAPRGGARGSSSAPRGGRAAAAPRGGAKKSEKAPQLTEENFPSLA